VQFYHPQSGRLTRNPRQSQTEFLRLKIETEVQRLAPRPRTIEERLYTRLQEKLLRFQSTRRRRAMR
jgi:hypothetical protein